MATARTRGPGDPKEKKGDARERKARGRAETSREKQDRNRRFPEREKKRESWWIGLRHTFEGQNALATQNRTSTSIDERRTFANKWKGKSCVFGLGTKPCVGAANRENQGGATVAARKSQRSTTVERVRQIDRRSVVRSFKQLELSLASLRFQARVIQTGPSHPSRQAKTEISCAKLAQKPSSNRSERCLLSLSVAIGFCLVGNCTSLLQL